MSYSKMLRHRCEILRLVESDIDGMPQHSWLKISEEVRVFLDLNFIRSGKDPRWTPEAGRPSDRSGVLFVDPEGDVRSGDRVRMTVGPHGTFQVEGAVDEAWTPTKMHHKECGVVEVAGVLQS